MAHILKDTPVSVNLGAGRTAVALDLGDLHTCAILDNGELKCWGFNQFGALGNGGNSNINSPPSSPINLGTGRQRLLLLQGHPILAPFLTMVQSSVGASTATAN